MTTPSIVHLAPFLPRDVRNGSGLAPTRPFLSAMFAAWVIELLGLQSTDVLDDLFPGTGIISRVWDQYRWHNAPRAAAQ